MSERLEQLQWDVAELRQQISQVAETVDRLATTVTQLDRALFRMYESQVGLPP